MVPLGGMVFGILTENMETVPNGPSNRMQVEAWIASMDAPNTWVHETVPDLTSGIEGEFMSARETYFLVDLSNMQILSRYFAKEAMALADLKARLQ